jgi:hypothetical protein
MRELFDVSGEIGGINVNDPCTLQHQGRAGIRAEVAVASFRVTERDLLRSKASPWFLAHIVTVKYVDALPLHRLSCLPQSFGLISP